jgi:multidrug resistance efflux pump
MDVKIKTEIRRLEELKNLKHREYIFNVEQIEQKIEQSKSQIDRTDSATKRDILKKQKVYYKEEINALDNAIENFTQSVDEKIEGLYKVLEVWIEKNKLEK